MNKLRITTENRTRLETVIPLSTPYLVFLDPSNLCNQQCEYCPTGNRKLMKQIGIKQQLMHFDLYRHIIDQFVDFPQKVKTLRLYKMGEPLLNPDFPDMVRYAKDSRYFGRIDTTSNGRLLTEKLSRLLILSGLNKIFISVPKDYDKQYIDNVKYLYVNSRGNLEVFVKIAGDYLNPREQEDFAADFSDISDSCAIEHTADCWPGFTPDGLNKKVGIYGQPIAEDIKVCPYSMYSMTINSDGTVSHCFLDWRQSFILGDLSKDKIKRIWDKECREIQMAMLAGYRHELPNCFECNHHLYGMPDNIDQYADELLKKY